MKDPQHNEGVMFQPARTRIYPPPRARVAVVTVMTSFGRKRSHNDVLVSNWLFNAVRGRTRRRRSALNGHKWSIMLQSAVTG